MDRCIRVNRTLILAGLFSGCVLAQTAETVNLQISSNPPGATFLVDGVTYISAGSFQWPAGSKHIVQFVATALPPDALAPGDPSRTLASAIQASPDASIIYAFTSWTDGKGLLLPGNDPVQTVTADPSVSSLVLNLDLYYRVVLNFWDKLPVPQPGCSGAPGITPPDLRGGAVWVNQGCYWNSALLYFQAGTVLSLNAFPYPGYVFAGWAGSITDTSYLTSYVLNGPIVLIPQFQVAKLVHVLTSPIGLQVLVDRTASPTLQIAGASNKATCPLGDNLPVGSPPTIPQLCIGDFDFATGSTHLIGAPTSQRDTVSNWWVFDSWSSTGGQSGQVENSVYTTDQNVIVPDTVTVKFDPAAQVSFVTNPVGLQLNVDGRANWPSYNFVWAVGSTHQVTAAAQQTDTSGRNYVFAGWSNGGAPAQSVSISQSMITSGETLVARYNRLSRVVIQTAPYGQTILVDGAPCQNPCIVDRASGAQVHVTAPLSFLPSPGTRYDFTSWSDGGAADHLFNLSADFQTLTANYSTSYLLTATASPANGATYTFNPPTPDLYYLNGTQVTISAQAASGFKFRRWGGDLSGTYPVGTLQMSTPHQVIALLDTVPYIAPAGVQNGAGVTPNPAVAPGSIIVIFGQSMSVDTISGPLNPLVQALDNVTVTVGNSFLPLFYVSPQQITAQLPSLLTPGNYTLTVHSQGQPDVTGNFSVARNAPGIFTNPANGKAYVLALHADGGVVTSESPAQAGETITIYGTGFGPYVAPVLDGFYPPSPAPALSDTIEIQVAGLDLSPVSAGAAPGYTGLVAMQMLISGLPAGAEVPLQVSINGVLSNTVILPLQ